MSNIVAFFGTAAVHIVYYGVFWDRRYRCSLLRHPTAAGHKTTAIQSFCSSKLDIAALQKPTTINISFCADTIAAVEKNTTICNLQWHLCDHHSRDSFLRVQFLSYSGRLDRRYRPSNSLPLPKSSLCFFWLFIFSAFSFLTKTLYISISFHSISLTLRRPKTHYSLYLSLTLQGPKIPPKHPAQTLFIFRTLSLYLPLSLSKSQTQNPTIITAFTSTPPPPPTPNAQWPPSRNPNPPHRRHLASPIHLVTATSFHSQKPNALSVSCLKHAFCFFFFFFFIYLCVGLLM